ncbi:MAG: phosphate acyltransferase PlsX [Gammaproteobacteria bacterium]|nr:phosphate acyltransferase PlsX [Gammaproteobacteria bacterium]
MTHPILTIAIDAMGGDHGPSVTVPASLKVLATTSHVNLILVGDQSAILRILSAEKERWSNRITIHPTTQVVEMDEPPARALRTKGDSSMRVAIDLVQQGKASACVSAGNTGALMVLARYVLKTLPGVDRPAIIAALPSLCGRTYVLDLGANVDCTPLHLLQFAIMGSQLASVIEGIPSPKVALLNIGTEDIKGNECVRQAAKLFSESPLINYAGFVEGNAIFKSSLHVVVCDGFVGNVAIKVSEGVITLIRDLVQHAFHEHPLAKLAALPLKGILKEVTTHLDPDENNGATFIGLQGTVVKSHGHAGITAFYHAIQKAIVEVEKDVNRLICQSVMSH